jgi:hypothetical protein
MKEENKEDFVEYVYRPKNYDGPLAIDNVPSEECKRFHENSSIVFILHDGGYLDLNYKKQTNPKD